MRNNNVTLTGNLGRDPQVRQAGEHKVVKMSLCVAGGKASQWFRLTAFDDVATECEAFRLGAFVRVEGRLSASTYEVDGERRYAVAVIVDRIRSIARKAESVPAAETATAGSSQDAPF
jgi:single-stranded DNA-binding protein